jgi:hypothetical protein
VIAQGRRGRLARQGVARRWQNLGANDAAGGYGHVSARHNTRQRTVRAVGASGCLGARAKGASPERASERAAPEKRFTLYTRVCGGVSVGETFYIYSLGV